jgi:hypothetical protein
MQKLKRKNHFFQKHFDISVDDGRYEETKEIHA